MSGTLARRRAKNDGGVLTHRAALSTRRHFTRLDQVTQLVNASEADAELGYMARLLALCSLPRTNPGNRLRYVRRNGPYTLIMTATGTTAKLPFGNLPRLLLAYVTTEAVRTQSRVLVLEDSLSAFMRKLGIYSTSGKGHTRLRNQINRLFHASGGAGPRDAGSGIDAGVPVLSGEHGRINPCRAKKDCFPPPKFSPA